MRSALSSSRPFTMAETLSIASYRWGAIAYVWPAAASLGCVDLGAAAAAATAICGGRRRSRRVAVVAKRRRAAVLGAPDVATAAGAGPAVRRASRPGCGGPPAMTAGGPSGVGRGAGEGGEGEGEEDSPAGAGEGAGAAPSGAAYVPTQEDLPEGVGDELPTKLTLSQQLLLKQYIEQVQTMSEQQCKELTLEVVRFSALRLFFLTRGRGVNPRRSTARGALELRRLTGNRRSYVAARGLPRPVSRLFVRDAPT